MKYPYRVFKTNEYGKAIDKEPLHFTNLYEAYRYIYDKQHEMRELG